MTSLLYLSGADVAELLPPVHRQLDLVREAYRAMTDGGAEVPATDQLHPHEGTFLHAMPAYLRERDVASVKWIGGNPANVASGIPYITGLIVLSDPQSGQPLAVMDAAAITAARTAAASGLCVQLFAPTAWSSAAITGFGVQARSHLAVLRALNPDVRVTVATRTPDRASEPGVAFVPTMLEAVRDADVVVTGVPLSVQLGRKLRPGDLRHEVLVLPIDYDGSVSAGLVEAADLFLVDDRVGVEVKRGLGRFAGWPEPHGTVGGYLAAPPSDPPGPLRVCCNLGVGALDAVFADEVVAAARAQGRGTRLPR